MRYAHVGRRNRWRGDIDFRVTSAAERRNMYPGSNIMHALRTSNQELDVGHFVNPPKPPSKGHFCSATLLSKIPIMWYYQARPQQCDFYAQDRARGPHHIHNRCSQAFITSITPKRPSLQDLRAPAPPPGPGDNRQVLQHERARRKRASPRRGEGGQLLGMARAVIARDEQRANARKSLYGPVSVHLTHSKSCRW